ncbi:nitrate- and nitrite sensing domain-containing protein [Kordiimonas lipolytica]|uniref:Nitrate- and nitrite sensing domain-containing protein n=1 Tax=Kordiimonas lipolytica TaxID=1662421 RepID=A0ABV8U8M4_9PROT|nr:nitrate- and nitrite sensing domain-containing protein [Kordiimonas lipolytica]
MNTPVQNTKLVQELLHKLGDVVHKIQRERGCAGLLLDSLGKIFSRRYDEQNKAVDKVIAELRAFSGRTDVRDALPPSFEARLTFLLRKFDELADVRDQIRLMKVRYTQALNNYTFKFTVPTIDAMIELAQREPRHNSALVSAYSNFLQWKERVGMERALGARGFYTFSFRNQEFCDRFVALVAEQRTYFDTFKALASPGQIAVLQEAVQDADLRALGKINDLLEEGAPPSEIEQYSGETWFELLTRMIDGLRQAEVTLVDGLEGAATPVSNSSAHSGKMAQYRPFLKSLPMLAALADGDLDELLSLSQVREYEKDKLLFLRDEPAARMYIILEGWVKAYNGLETGEEAILQMLGAGETLLESAVFLNMPTPVNAQVVEHATLLSIPAPVIRQRIQASPQLAVNMLNAVSLRSQRLVQQLELSRLKSAQERVGWFLLRLRLNQKSPDGTILLPYEKSIIASYLDMRPETFSRTLKKFKDEGFKVATDYVVMPDDNALCGFCDAELAGNCNRVHTDECARPELSDLVFKPDA